MADPLHAATPPPYDSASDTLAHIRAVQDRWHEFDKAMDWRLKIHDQSKLQEPEKPAFDRLTPKLKTLTYGSEQYRNALAELGPALQHHYAKNSHHPEFFGDAGIAGMSLLDLVEMLCDWKAATQRMKDGSLQKSIQQNQTRFNISPQLTQILENTRKELNW